MYLSAAKAPSNSTVNRTARMLVGIAAVASTALVASCSTGGSTSGAEEGFRNGEAVTIVVPASPGGGFDVEARLLQPVLQRELQDITGTNVTVRVENAPGAGGRIGAQRVYNGSESDNLVWYYYTNTLVGSEIADGAEAAYKSDEFVPLAIWGNGPSAIALPAASLLPERTLEELSERSTDQSLLIGSTGLHREIAILAGGLTDAGAPFDFDIVESEGTSDMIAMLLRGDVELAYTTGSGLRPFVDEEPDLEFLASMACDTDPSLPGVPTIVDLGWPNAEEICQNISVPRVFLGGPSMPEGKAKQLETALLAAMQDPDFQAEAEAVEHFLQPGDATVARDALESKVKLYEIYSDTP